jgi:nitrogen fixation/metabolism regulation signal transduction histidine kinase
MNPLLQGTRAIRYSLVVLGALSGILLFLLASASSSTSLFDENYSVLILLNGAVAAGLLLLVLLLVFRLVRRYRQGVFGSRLLVRLSLSFALMGLVPGLLLYVVSVQFLARSLDSWFNVRVDSALEAGLNLGRIAVDNITVDTRNKAQAMAQDMGASTDEQQTLMLNRLREAAGLDEVSLLNNAGRVIHSTNDNINRLAPEAPGISTLRQITPSRPYAKLENETPDDLSDLRVNVVVAIPMLRVGFNSAPRYLMVVQRVPPTLAQQALSVQKAYRDYQEVTLSKAGLRKIYAVTLTLATLLTIFLAIGVAFWLSSRLAAPILWLAEGTRAVAQGNFQPMEQVTADSELRELVQSFNTMTQQLSETRSRLETNQLNLTRANEFLKRLLGSLSSGVLVLDRQFHLRVFNNGAQRIFERDLQSLAGRPIDEFEGMEGFAVSVRAAFADLEDDSDNPSWQRQIELPRKDDPNSMKVLLVRGSRMTVGGDSDYVMVCDDISELVSAQRTVAWAEVARRLAHEIKNPLTPIQLSAERLQMKLADLLDEQHQGLLTRATRTIVNQVAAMKRMVDEFRDYARMPPTELKPLDLNELVRDILGLYGHADPDRPDLRQRVSSLLADGLPWVEGDPTQLRQVIHNLLQNAHESVNNKADGRVEIRTELVQVQKSSSAPQPAVRLVIADNGSGFAAEMMVRAFEPYVTNKSGGTGLGLAIVKKIVDEHGGKILLRNRTNALGEVSGAAVEITFLRLADSAGDKESLELQNVS